jgi:hypothetical protein
MVLMESIYRPPPPNSRNGGKGRDGRDDGNDRESRRGGNEGNGRKEGIGMGIGTAGSR